MVTLLYVTEGLGVMIIFKLTVLSETIDNVTVPLPADAASIIKVPEYIPSITSAGFLQAQITMPSININNICFFISQYNNSPIYEIPNNNYSCDLEFALRV